MRISIGPETIDQIRDALDLACRSPTEPALAGIDWTGGVIEFLASKTDLPLIRLVSADKQHIARFDEDTYSWQRLHVCDDCGAEQWSEHRGWSCNCKVEPTRNDPEGWRE